MELENERLVNLGSTAPAGALDTGEAIEADLPQHPVVKAWRRLGYRVEGAPQNNRHPGQEGVTRAPVGASGIEVLKGTLEPTVYRLVGVGPGGGTVVARRRAPESAVVERVVYEEILPHLPVTGLQYYGFLEGNGENGDPRPCWLFTEDAGGEQYSPYIEEHRTLGGRWLAAVHSAAARLPVAASLPAQGPDDYLGWLRAARQRIDQSFGNPALGDEDRDTLKRILWQCDVVESHWSEAVRFCNRMPRTLVHGDLTINNIRVRSGPHGNTLVVMDWGSARWGVPAIDFAQIEEDLCPDIEAYSSAMQPFGPRLDARDVQRLADWGTVFRLLFHISSCSIRLRWDRPKKLMKPITAYQTLMAKAIQSLGWGDGAVETAPPVGKERDPWVEVWKNLARRPADQASEAGLPEHPAAKAWGRLQMERVAPEQIEVVKEEIEPTVYRLIGVGPGGCTVIAKRRTTASAAVERAVYEEILSRLPVAGLQYYGFLEGNAESGDPRPCWLFTEDAGGERYSPHLEDHRALAGRWLAAVHSAAARLPVAASLPVRGPDHYLGWLRASRQRIDQSFGNYALGDEDRDTLKRILRQCDVVESHWSEVVRFCDRMPRTLIHGDFTVNNARVRSGPHGKTFVVIDWESAGWGVPAVDLAQWDKMVRPDIAAYSAACWPRQDPRDLQTLVDFGTIFRLLFHTHFEADMLGREWVRSSMKRMRLYQAQLAEAIRAVGWGDGVMGTATKPGRSKTDG